MIGQDAIASHDHEPHMHEPCHDHHCRSGPVDRADDRGRTGRDGPRGPGGPRIPGRHARAAGVSADDRDGCARFLEGLDELDEAEAEGLARRLREMRREQGPEHANEQWMDGPLHAWLDRLERRCVDLDTQTLAAIAVGMREVLSIRDALILSMLFDAGRCGRRTLMGVLSRPRTDEVSNTVRDLLVTAFDDEHGPDVDRCQTGVTMLTAMTCLMPHSFGAQPFAAIAYILWWLGDSRAPLYALRSLEVDDRCSLAAIVLSASERGLCPACAKGKDGVDPVEGGGM